LAKAVQSERDIRITIDGRAAAINNIKGEIEKIKNIYAR
jgi:hypothetical protein